MSSAIFIWTGRNIKKIKNTVLIYNIKILFLLLKKYLTDC